METTRRLVTWCGEFRDAPGFTEASAVRRREARACNGRCYLRRRSLGRGNHAGN
jgi:hypothetical protein